MMTKGNISLFRTYFDTNPVGEITIGEFCNYTKTGWGYCSQIKKIRNPNTTDNGRKQLKAQLPAATISGTFIKRETAGLLNHSGFICLDIDGKDNPSVTDWPELRDKLMEYNNIMLSALSVSGKGVFIIIPLQHPERHHRQFARLQRDFQSLDITIDPSCSNICRLRGISHDPEAKVNLDALPYQGLQKEEVLNKATFNDDDLSRLIQLITDSRTDITDGYTNWYSIGCSLANELGEGGRDYYHQISQYYDYYSKRETNRQFNACLKRGGNFTKSTIFYIANQNGINLKAIEGRVKQS